MFAKIFSQIYDSSIRENPEMRFTFMDMLVLADINGVVDMTHEAIAARTNRPLEVIRKTISELEGPDPRSRTPDNEGRRIARLDDHRDWGWMIVNYDRFRKTASDEQRREKTRLRVAKYKQKFKQNDTGNASVTLGNAGNAMQRQMAEADGRGHKQKEEAVKKSPSAPLRPHFSKPSIEEIKLQCAKIGLPETEAEGFFFNHESKGWKIGNAPMVSWPAALQTWKRNYEKFGARSNGFQKPKVEPDYTKAW